MQFSDKQWQEMQAVYEVSWTETQSPIRVIHELIARFNLSVTNGKNVFERLHCENQVGTKVTLD